MRAFISDKIFHDPISELDVLDALHRIVVAILVLKMIKLGLRKVK